MSTTHRRAATGAGPPRRRGRPPNTPSDQTEAVELVAIEATPGGGAPLPGALLDAIEALRSVDQSYVDFLSGMYVEVRRHEELQAVFQQGPRFAVFDHLRRLADDTTFDRTVAAFRDGFGRFAQAST